MTTSQDQQQQRHSPPHSAIGRALYNFSSQWFLIAQGTGIIAVILFRLNYQFTGLETISKIIWVYTIVLLGVSFFLYALRIFLYPHHVVRQLRTSIVETSCLSSISIAFTSVIQMMCLTIVHEWGSAWGTVVCVLWWINTFMAVVAVLGIPYVYVRVQPPGLAGVTPAVLLPLIAALTSAAGGGVVCRFGGIGYRYQVPIIIVSYLEIGIGLPLAVVLETIYLLRLFDKHFPSSQAEIYQTMILCGPFGQASFALQILGDAVKRGTFAAYDRGAFVSESAAPSIALASQFAGLLSWGFGTFWWAFAIICITHSFFSHREGLSGLKFSMAAWSLVFPWGVYTNAAVMLGVIMDSATFKVWSTVLAILLVLIWITNQIFTVKGIFTGEILGLENGWKHDSFHHRLDDYEDNANTPGPSNGRSNDVSDGSERGLNKR